jgi:hypothetical protein
MRITIESTLREVHIGGERARVWQGVSENGWPVAVIVARIAVTDDFPNPSPGGIEVIKCVEPNDDAREAFPDLEPYDPDAWRKSLLKRIENGDGDDE